MSDDTETSSAYRVLPDGWWRTSPTRTETDDAPLSRVLERLVRQLAASRAVTPSPPSLLQLLDEAQQPKPKPKPTTPRVRKPSLGTVISQMKQQGLDIAGCEVTRDGALKVITGKPVDATDSEMDDTTSPRDRSEWH